MRIFGGRRPDLTRSVHVDTPARGPGAIGLPQLPSGKIYEAWFIEGGNPVPAGLIGRDPGQQLALLDGQVDDATAVALTVEPAGGSPQPTTVPLGAVGPPA